MFARREDLAALLDATLLRPDAGDEDVVKLAGQARRDGCAAVCVAPQRLPAVARILRDSSTLLASTVSFPAGNSTLATKTFAALEALRLGAHELDVVCDLDSVRRGDINALEKEMGELMARTPEAVHKFIIELAWLPAPAWRHLGKALRRLRPAFVKTGTGVNAGPVTLEQVRRLRDVTGDDVAIKAAGGINTLQGAFELARAGAARLGSSAAAELLAAWDLRR